MKESQLLLVNKCNSDETTALDISHLTGLIRYSELVKGSLRIE